MISDTVIFTTTYVILFFVSMYYSISLLFRVLEVFAGKYYTTLSSKHARYAVLAWTVFYLVHIIEHYYYPNL